MSEIENPELTDPRRRITADDIRATAGAATPHFALQVRNRLRRLAAPLAAGDPARRQAELEIERLERLAREGRRETSGGADLSTLGDDRRP